MTIYLFELIRARAYAYEYTCISPTDILYRCFQTGVVGRILIP